MTGVPRRTMAHTQCFDRIAGALDRWGARADDTPAQRETKRMLVLMLLCVLVVLSCSYAASLDQHSPLRSWGTLALLSLFCLLFAYIRIARSTGSRFVTLAAFVFCSSLCLNDFWSAIETNRRVWPTCIILLDFLLIVKAPSSLTLSIVVSMCVYLCVMAMEETWRVGLFDVPSLAPYEHRACQGTCEKPPCARPFIESLIYVAADMSVFLMDFYITRGFALQVRREKERMAAAVTAAQHVAERLASFDLDAAEDVLESQEDMPPDLCESLRVILSHLRAYKPFLPQSVLVMAASQDTHASNDSNDGLPRSPVEEPVTHTPPSTRFLVKRRISLVHLHASLLDVTEILFASVHSQMLQSVLKHAATCKGVVDHFCGDAVSLSYNASSQCARHPTMAVQTAAALCLGSQGDSRSSRASVVRGGVATGPAHVGTMGVPELQRHCIVGMLDTVCQNIVQAAVILRHPLLSLHATAVDVTFCWQTRVLLDRVVFSDNLASLAKTQADDAADNAFSGCAGVVYEVLGAIGRVEGDAVLEEAEGSVVDKGTEWMYELEAAGTPVYEWEVYNKAGLAFHRGGGSADAAVLELRTGSASADHTALFSTAASESRVLNFRTRVAPHRSMY
eukprot:Rhum_TRINITY_DN15268_c3_g1::Rhum_TRINITY_DN15268_c3_g1_i15::g.147551::m.147551